MAVTTVSIFREFYNDETFWAPGYWHEDECITLDGEVVYDVEVLNAANPYMLVSINDGAVYGDDAKYICTFDEWFERWVARRTTKTLVVNIPRERYSELLIAIKELGGTYEG